MKKAEPKRGSRPVLLAGVTAFLQQLAPPHLAEPWDHVGLLSGAATAPITRILIALDLTRAVAGEAIRAATDLLICYHPPIFKPIADLRFGGDRPEELAVELASKHIWIYSPHTALDAARGGTNDALAAALNLSIRGSLSYQARPGRWLKLVTFVPESAVERVADAVYTAGAGHIGKNSRYSQCSFRTPGTGTFFGDESTRPAVGQKGQLERVPEIRFETVMPAALVADVVAAMRNAHPYEEPAFDLVVLENPPEDVGLGRLADLTIPVPLKTVAGRFRQLLRLSQVRVMGPPNKPVRRLAIIAGSAGRLPLEALQRGTAFDCVVTGELKHHDLLAIRAAGLTAISLGHAASERPVLSSLRNRLSKEFSALSVEISRCDPTPYAII